MLRDLWNRLLRRERDARIEHDDERQHMTREERRITGESVDDIQADGFVDEHLGGIDPARLSGDDEPPREDR
jgi:hypothetical protein